MLFNRLLSDTEDSETPKEESIQVLAAIGKYSPRANWLALFAALLAAWVLLFAMAVPDDLRQAENLLGADFLLSLCTVSLSQSGYANTALMWAIMSFGMMAPTALPAFRTSDDLGHATATRFWSLIAGYSTIWIGFSLLTAATQLALFRYGVIGVFGQSLSPVFSGLLLIGAGLYQFSALKEACLSKCRLPLTFFMQHWDEGPFRNGLRLGAICMGCCWALMLLGFVGGVMNIAFMGLAMILMTLEKLPDIRRWLTRPLGSALIAAGSWVVLTGL